jgi:hypothetical protein
MSIIGECCMLPGGRGVYDGPIPRPDEFYRLCVSLSVIMCKNNSLHLK